jgi:hypothetical protein
MVRTLPEGPEWEYELKLDGYRVQAVKDGDNVRLYSRRGSDFTRKFARTAAQVSKIKAGSFVLDGEAVAVDAQGRPFVPNASSERDSHIFCSQLWRCKKQSAKKPPAFNTATGLTPAIAATGGSGFFIRHAQTAQAVFPRSPTTELSPSLRSKTPKRMQKSVGCGKGSSGSHGMVDFQGVTDQVAANQGKTFWTSKGRCLVFLLAFSSIACLLSDFYGLCPMRFFTPFIFLPALVVLVALAMFDWQRGDGQLCRAVLIGLAGGLLAAVAYDVFRLPFVFANEWGISSVVPPMKLFKVFPRFGAMILGQPIEQSEYSLSASLLGWAYHFSNGATFGVMYLAMIGDARRRHWAWAIAMAVALELGMLLTPYPRVFGIPISTRFVVVTMAAHAAFGVGLGLSVKAIAERRSRIVGPQWA